MEAIIQALLTMVGGILPKIGVSDAASAVVDEVISGLETVVPLVISTAPTLIADVQGVIASLRNGSTPLTADQLAALDAQDAALDAAFEADATAAGAAPAPGTSS